MITVHCALIPQDPGHGSIHLSFWQAKLLEHAALIVHSGLQFGGEPRYDGKHEHAGKSPISRHFELGPQGFGSHAATRGGSVVTKR